METLTSEIVAAGFFFLEGPRWHDGRLWFSDMMGGVVYALDGGGRAEAIVGVPERPSGLGFLPDGTPLVVSMRDRRLYRIEAGALVLHADLSGLVAGDINDMVVDAGGRAYVGNFGFDYWNDPDAFVPSTVIVVEPDGAARVGAGGFDFPNGMAIDANAGRLIVAESYGKRLKALDIDSDGGLANPHTFADLGEHTPDGICLDAEGAVWVSAYVQGVFLRVEEGGNISHTVKLSARRAVACQLGGGDGRTLYCLTSSGGSEQRRASEKGGRVESLRVDVPGAGSP
jgi:sugar lactone lactonase YvrE